MIKLENNIIETNEKPLDERFKGGAGYFCFKYMKENEDKLAQINVSTGEKETYKNLLEKCIRTSIVLQKLGIKKGDVLTFCSKVTLNSCVPLIASFFIGAVPSYLDGTFHLYEFLHFIKCVNPKLFLVTPDMVNFVQDLTKNEHLQNTYIAVFSDDFLKPQDEEKEFKPIYLDDIQETAIIHFSSGSTGFPKGICLSHYSLLCCKFTPTDNVWVDNEPKVAFSYDSFHWTVETLRLFCSIREGICRLISTDEDDLKKVWNILEKYKVNIAYFVPWLLMDMLEIGKPTNIDLNNLTTIIVEGSSLPAKYLKIYEKLLPNVDIFNMYGLTETGTLAVFQNKYLHRQYNRSKPDCSGMPIPDFGMKFKVVDIDSGKILGPNERGELRVKSKTIMNGYYNLDSSDQFDEDGYLKSGDLAYYDHDLCFFIVSRVKDLIVYQGWHIIPAALESELLSHPAVKAAAVVGVRHEKDTEHPLGLVALHCICKDVTPNEIEKYVEARVPDKYRLRAGVRIVEESYLRTGNKMQRYKLKQLVFSGKI